MDIIGVGIPEAVMVLIIGIVLVLVIRCLRRRK